jgi:hypothetical protein
VGGTRGWRPEETKSNKLEYRNRDEEDLFKEHFSMVLF